jgi:hypothetical protein
MKKSPDQSNSEAKAQSAIVKAVRASGSKREARARAK